MWMLEAQGQERGVEMKIIREDGLDIGQITQVADTPKSLYGAYQGSGTWLASSSQGGSKYFVSYSNATKWLERRSKNTYLISRLAEFLNS